VLFEHVDYSLSKIFWTKAFITSPFEGRRIVNLGVPVVAVGLPMPGWEMGPHGTVADVSGTFSLSRVVCVFALWVNLGHLTAVMDGVCEGLVHGDEMN